jgi:50S ribosomal protein L16 3-hydroxylase
MMTTLLGGMTPRQFLRDYWQKKPLLVRQSIPGFRGVVTKPALMRLAAGRDVESRLVTQQQGKWRMERGPFSRPQFKRLPKTNWTVLVQDLNHFVAAGRDLLQHFSFIPYARLDDLMVSYAAPGGGVGPHFDSYDVFLLQGEGERRWRISGQRDLTLLPNSALKILKNFKAEQEWTLAPGDLLYLPPNIAHDGVAESECTTYSIGFRAPSAQELAFHFLNFLQDELKLTGMYSDPDLRAQTHPAEMGNAMVRQTARMLKKLTWDNDTCARFLGNYLTEPKAHVFFTPPAESMTLAQFRRELRARGLALNLKSRMLSHKQWVFMNGECLVTPPGAAGLLRELCDHWMIAPDTVVDQASLRILHEWRDNGYLALRGENADAGNN